MNEILLISSLLFIYGTTLLAYRFLGRAGLFGMTVAVTILANIEVVILITAFGIEQTLGNVLFATTFLITDILSECEGKKYANRAVVMGLGASLFFLTISQSWRIYQPSINDTMHPMVYQLFSLTPRIIIASFIAFAISQFFDVWIYHKWWQFTEKRTGSRHRFLWLRNNGSTLISQFINTLIFTMIAFVGIYDFKTLFSIFTSSYIIYTIASLLDTPIVYWARKIKEKQIQTKIK